MAELASEVEATFLPGIKGGTELITSFLSLGAEKEAVNIPPSYEASKVAEGIPPTSIPMDIECDESSVDYGECLNRKRRGQYQEGIRAAEEAFKDFYPSARVMSDPSSVITDPTLLLKVPKPLKGKGKSAKSTASGIAKKLASDEIGGDIIGWGTGQSAAAVAKTQQATKALTESKIKEMIPKGLTKEWVEDQLRLYTGAIAKAGPKLKNTQLFVRKEMMERILLLWPK